MSASPPASQRQDHPEEVREIAKWAKIYAQNRTIPVLVFFAFYILFSVAIGGSSYLAAGMYSQGQVVWFSVCLVVLACSVLGVVWLALRGSGLIGVISARLYGGEGSATPPALTGHRPRWVPAVAVLALGSCIAACVILGFLGYIPLKYTQPVSALYTVPFLVFLALWLRPVTGPLPLLWPVLYGLHAILVVAGVPFPLIGERPDLHMVVSTVGYGVLAALVAHGYSRFALWKLRRLARVEATSDVTESEAGRG